MNRYDLLIYLPLWLRYLPICLAIFFSMVDTAFILICKFRRKKDDYVNILFVLNLACQIFHFVFVSKFDVLFILAIILFAISLTLFSVFHRKENIKFFSVFCPFLFYLSLGCAHNELKWTIICGLIILSPYLWACIVFLFENKKKK